MNNTKTSAETAQTAITPEVSRTMRENVRGMIRNLLSEFMNEQKAYIVKLADFKKWCKLNYESGNTLVTEAQNYYIKAGFTDRIYPTQEFKFYYSGSYGFWEYERLERWCSKMNDISVYKKDNRIMLDNWSK